MTVSHVVLGIGNIGCEYDNTRHNIGFDVVDCIKDDTTKDLNFKYSKAFEKTIGENQVIFIKPNTYVNLSGKAAKEIIEKYELSEEQLIVVVDDFHLPLGSLRYRQGGSAGGHNGLKSLIEECGANFIRVKVGIGPLPDGISVVDFVLGKFLESEQELSKKMAQFAAETLPTCITEGLTTAMNKHNGQKFILPESGDMVLEENK